MLLGAALLVCIGTVPLFGGRLEALAELELRARWSLLAALGTQMTIVYVLPDLPTGLLNAAHIGSYLFAACFLVANRRVPGLLVIALGGVSNFVAIAANGGVMPATRAALETAGLDDAPGQFASSIAVGNPKLGFLGDVFAVPASFPVHNVFSVGDVLIVIGAFILLHRVCDSALFRRRDDNFRGLVRNRSFLRAWGAQGISNLGDWTYALAVFTALAERHAGAHAFSTLLIAQVAPAALTGALGGPLIDRLPRKHVMMAADAVRLAAVGSLLVVGDLSLVHLYAVAACIGAGGALFGPSMKASLPTIVPRERLVTANAMLTGTFHLAIMVGPVVGAMVAVSFGPKLAIGMNAATFAASFLLIAGVRMPFRPAAAVGSTRRALAEGFAHIGATPLVRGVMLVIGLVMVAAALRTPLEPLFILRTLGEHPEALGVAGGAWGLGMVIGSGIAPALARRWARERLLAASIAVVGAGVLLSSQATSLNPVLGLWLVAGVGNAVAVISYNSLLQERTPDNFRGRVVAASEAVLDASLIIGALLAGSLGAALGARGAFVLSGLLFLVTAAIARALLVVGSPDPTVELPEPDAVPAPARS